MYIVLLLTLVFSLSSAVSYATVETYEQQIARGVALMEAKDFRDASASFSSALRDRPDDFTATQYLGIAQSRAGDKEAEATLKKALALKPGDPRTLLELGIWYFNKAAYGISRDYLRNAVSAAPNTEVSSMAEEYLRAMASGKASKPWMLNISLGGQYDTNVVLGETGGLLPAGITKKADWSAVAYLKGQYTFLTTDRAEASVAYSLYQSVHAKLSDFDVSYHLFDLKTTYAFSQLLTLRGTASFEYTFMGGNDYAAAYTFSPAMVIAEGNGNSTVIEYAYKKSRFINSDLFFDNSDRTGSNNAVGITQNIPLYRSAIAKVGYSHDVDTTQQQFWTYRGDKAFVGLQVEWPKTIYLDLYGEYYHRNYKGPFVAGDENRKDQTSTASLSVTKLLSQTYSVTIAEMYVRNKSNTPDFDYKRSITGLFLNARF